MKAVSLFARLGVFAFVLILLREVMEHPMFSDSSTQVPPTTVDFAVSILNDWAIITIVLGILLAMAMIGASYLVRDERLVNLLYDMGGEER
jgi:NADH:ubiquinone oxidoreductase subunit 6 (subunit J)